MGCKLVVHFIVGSFFLPKWFFFVCLETELPAFISCPRRRNEGVFVFFHLFRSHFTSFLIAALDTRSWLRRSNVPGTV
ncbi:hypothetical protein COCC4DRAFT_161063 [Bipolaris maydis ATCC 48331]|uniref:Uncharacterized protein n=2 Tax=Cochliobolus heterostrophus TaxID=5016 RepID=M2UD87_COCH5|nr:uncharacterized protein COCC4DRAFT_161063 [Bipolaris maydis ATCC 48331]EMD91661.1 hypothetical protein COCHEDRAFT_1175827 [Bipolaris maydis C5]ENI08582.1 hypothetical protein COCC4DRAFT_161063 [Bipolaris maydis ATCC 48331]KAJ6209029.1 hypothetical protein PSV09DRAFT_1175827 [Bipolaris maydis]